jgi:hypothetical protein
MLPKTLDREGYFDLIKGAKIRYKKGKFRNGFGWPPTGQPDWDNMYPRPLPSDIKACETPKKIRDFLYSYFSDPKHAKNLKNPFSFESYLLAELCANDTNYANKWAYFVSVPLMLYKIKKKEEGLLFRGIQAKNIRNIFENGVVGDLDPPPKENIMAYSPIGFFVNGPTGFSGLSTTTSFSVADFFAQPHGYVLVIDFDQMKEHGLNNGIDVGATLLKNDKTDGQLFNEHEVKFPISKIPSDCILGAYQYTLDSDNPYIYFKNSNYGGRLDNDDPRNQHPINPSEIIESDAILKARIARIIKLIKKKTENGEWQLGFGGSFSKICLDGKKYPVPEGISLIYKIAKDDSLSPAYKLEEISKIAKTRKNQHTTFFGLVERSPLTQYIYAKIASIVDGLQEDVHFHAEPCPLLLEANLA